MYTIQSIDKKKIMVVLYKISINIELSDRITPIIMIWRISSSKRDRLCLLSKRTCKI